MTTPDDTGRGATLRAVLYFLASTPFLVILALTLHFTGVLTLEKVTELIHGKKPEAVAVNPNGGVPKLDPPPPPGVGPGPGPSTPPVRPVEPAPTVTPPPNQPPTVTATSALVFGKREASKVVEIKVTDETPAGVKLEAKSLNESLIPAAGLRFDGMHLTVTPAPGKWGEASVRVTATDPQKLTGWVDVPVTVPEPALVLTPLPDVTVKRGDRVPPVAVGWRDESAVPGKVSVTARTQGPLLPDAVAKVENQRLDLTPEKGKVGASEVTVVVTADDGRRAEAKFTLTVTPPPPLPLMAGGKARVTPAGGADLISATRDQIDGGNAGTLSRGTEVRVVGISGARAEISWLDGAVTRRGWLDATDLTPIE